MAVAGAVVVVVKGGGRQKVGMCEPNDAGLCTNSTQKVISESASLTLQYFITTVKHSLSSSFILLWAQGIWF